MKKIAAIIMASFLLAGCGASGRAMGLQSEKMEASTAPRGAAVMDQTPMASNYMKDAEPLAVSEPATPREQDITQDRKKIKTAQVEFQVPTLTGIEESLKKKVEGFKGYLATTSLGSSVYTAQVRIPVENFEAFLSQAGDLGTVLSKNSQIDDVTGQYFDLENRIKNKRILVKRFQTYLSETRSIEDVMKVERQLSEVTNELESLEGSFKNLSSQVSLSTLNMTFRLPSAAIGYQAPSLADGFADLGRNVVDFLYGFFFFLIYLIIFSIPIGGLLFLVWIILFGKKGLIRKAFTKKDK